jgi:hypothetical protein
MKDMAKYRDLTIDMAGVPAGNELSIICDLGKIQHVFKFELDLAIKVDQQRRRVAPIMPYTNPELPLDGAGRLLLGIACTDNLKTFTEYLRHKDDFNADNWVNPWQDYVDYLYELFRLDVNNKIEALNIKLNDARKEEHKEEAKRIHHDIELLRKGCDAMVSKFNAFKDDYAKHPDTKTIPDVEMIADDGFAQAWEDLFIKKNDKTLVAIRSGTRPIINKNASNEKRKIESLTKMKGELPKKIDDLFPITLNLQIGDFDWPIAEFKDKP